MADPKAQEILAAAQEHQRNGRFAQAAELFNKVLSIEPGQASAMHQWGAMAMGLGQIDLAVELLSKACMIRPDWPESLSALGLALAWSGKPDQAIEACEAALRLRPGWSEALNNLGIVRAERGELDLAVDAFAQGLAAGPDTIQKRLNLANALVQAAKLKRAIDLLRTTVSRYPESAEAHNELGTALRENGEMGEAIAAYARAIEIKPGFTKALANLGMAYLKAGDFERGLPLYQHRFAAKFGPNLPGWAIEKRWDGSDPRGKRIYLRAEGGFGDVIQMSRYAPLLAEKGARVTIGVYPPLMRLCNSLRGVDAVASADAPPPEFDFQLPIMTLPLAMGTTVDTIPGKPYLSADPAAAARWREKLAQLPGAKIGVVWAGNPANKADRTRSVPAQEMAALSRVPGVSLVSLQKGAGKGSARDWEKLSDWTDQLSDFADTAALIESLDAVVAVETAVAHLAGAMGKRVFLLLAAAPSWQWLLDRADSPWYPTMKLLRQQTIGDWRRPLEQVAGELGALAGR